MTNSAIKYSLIIKILSPAHGGTSTQIRGWVGHLFFLVLLVYIGRYIRDKFHESHARNSKITNKTICQVKYLQNFIKLIIQKIKIKLIN